MNLSTIEQGEELLKKATPGPWEVTDQEEEITSKNGYVVSMGYEGDGGFSLKGDRDLVVWLINHASELLQMAREVEGMKAALVEAAESLNRGTKLMREYEGALLAGEAISALHRAMDKTD